ncbi:MAG: type II toxin-antitoxin system Phd/YefM family antitoxin [Planctomycetota bacterium]
MAEIDPAQDIVPLTEFRSKVSDYISQTKRTKRPIVITQHGHGSAVMMSAEEYSALLKTIEILRSGIQANIDSMNGKSVPHEEAMKIVEKKIKAQSAKAESRKKSA